MIKVCIDPGCEEIAHNVSKKETRCRNCSMILVEINEATYRKKFINHYFQRDYSTDDHVTPVQMGFDIQLSLNL